MPRANKLSNPPSGTEKRTSGDSYALPDFVSCDLTNEERETIKENLVPVSVAFDKLDELIVGGYKWSLSYDDNADCHMVVLTCKNTKGVNFGYALSGRGPSLQGALTVILYKHFEKLKEDWPAHSSKAKKQVWG